MSSLPPSLSLWELLRVAVVAVPFLGRIGLRTNEEIDYLFSIEDSNLHHKNYGIFSCNEALFIDF